MSETNTMSQQLVTELKVSAHLMLLQTGLYCVYHAPGSTGPDAATGLPGARITLPPGPLGRGVTISGFREDGWLGPADTAALIRVTEGPAQVLMTVYQMPSSPHEPPKLQVLRLVEGVTAAAPVPLPAEQPARLSQAEPEEAEEGKPTVEGGDDKSVPEPEISAHIQLRGDVLARVGEWIGERGSRRWIEGFALAPRGEVAPGDIEYQAVLGRGWLSPWAEGGQYCGSRGMALPILGMRVRLRGDAAETHRAELYATFTDGSEVGPIVDGEPCESANLAPLEAFQIKLVPLAGEAEGDAPEATSARKPARRAAAPKAKPAPAPKPAAPKPPASRQAAPKPAAPKAAAPKAAAPAAKPVRPTARMATATRAAPKPAAGKPGRGRR